MPAPGYGAQHHPTAKNCVKTPVRIQDPLMRPAGVPHLPEALHRDGDIRATPPNLNDLLETNAEPKTNQNEPTAHSELRAQSAAQLLPS